MRRGYNAFIMLPVLRKCISFVSLKDGTIDLADIVLINRALFEESEAQRRAFEAQTKKLRQG